jgi:hypothetical protein
MMTTAPTKYTIELMEHPSPRQRSQPSACRWFRVVVYVWCPLSRARAACPRPPGVLRLRTPRCYLEYARPDPACAPGARRVCSPLESGGWMQGRPESQRRHGRNRPRSRSDSDMSDGGGVIQRGRESPSRRDVCPTELVVARPAGASLTAGRAQRHQGHPRRHSSIPTAPVMARMCKSSNNRGTPIRPSRGYKSTAMSRRGLQYIGCRVTLSGGDRGRVSRFGTRAWWT